ncbi:MAG: ATP-binding cassette domain-containing protein, partial [Bacteroidetes bacterium]|nr:ATP-binding cassette domain-containing protein [Bacteroidota bacterium]
IEEMSFTNILIIDEGSGDHPYHSKHMVSKELTGLITILRLSEMETYFIKYIGITSLTLNGLPLNSRKIYIFPAGSTIRGTKINPVYYSDVVGKFLYSEVETKLSFVADNITFKFKSGHIGLRDINIAEEGGKLMGIMGASGSGKSTLLNVLNGNEVPSAGRVLINGVDIHQEKDRIEGVIGYVPQDDFLFEDLTVFQNLYYAARLCFKQHTQAETEDLVTRVLRSLGLTDIKELKVGSPLDKTISGGQRKRLNIGLELIREPIVLFVDEPTSGLSSRDSENIMDLLKELSLRGKMVFVVIHQPSSDIFKMFDTLMILDVGGLMIYYGKPVEAVTYFKEIASLADRDQGSCIQCGTVRVEEIFNIIETKVVNEYGRFTDQRKVNPTEWHEHFKKFIKMPKIETIKEPLKIAQQIPNKIKQLKIFTIRDIKSKLSNNQYMVINSLEAPVLAFFLAYIARYFPPLEIEGLGYVFSKNVNIPVFFFMSIFVALFMGLTVSAEEIIHDRKILKRESFLNLSRISYLFSKVLILFAISAIQTLLFVLIGEFILEIKGMTLSYWMILFTTSCVANMMGLNISSAFDSAVTVYILIPILLIPQLILSGVVINFDKFNPQVTTMDEVPIMGDIMPSRWAFEAVMVAQFKNNEFEQHFYDYDKVIADAEYKTAYHIPVLESKLSLVFNNMVKDQSNNYKEAMGPHFELLRNEIDDELDMVGKDKLPEFDRLNVDQFDSTVYQETAFFLRTLRKFYNNKFNITREEKDQLIAQMTNTAKKRAFFEKMRQQYQNESLGNMVKNRAATDRIIEKDGRLIQKIYPIYNEPTETDGPLDFRTKFFAPKKHFWGNMYDTPYFNMIIIWLMSIFLMIALYYDGLRKLIKLFIRGIPFRYG